MAGPNDLLTKAFIAGAAIVKNTIVKFDAAEDTVIAAAAATDQLLGVALHAAAAGERVDVQLLGIAEIKAGGAITRGDFVTSDAAAEGVALSAAATIKSGIGMALATAADGDIIPVLLSQFEAVTA